MTGTAFIDDPYLVIVDYGSLFYSAQFQAVLRGRNNPDLEQLRRNARDEIERKREEQAALIRGILGPATRILEIHDGARRPEAKRAICFKRWKRRKVERGKYGRLRCGRFADETMTGLGKRAADKVSASKLTSKLEHRPH